MATNGALTSALIKAMESVPLELAIFEDEVLRAAANSREPVVFRSLSQAASILGHACTESDLMAFAHEFVSFRARRKSTARQQEYRKRKPDFKAETPTKKQKSVETTESPEVELTPEKATAAAVVPEKATAVVAVRGRTTFTRR